MEKLDLFYPLDKVVVSAEQWERVLPLQVWAVPECERALGRKEEAIVCSWGADRSLNDTCNKQRIDHLGPITAGQLMCRSCLYPGIHLNIKIST